MLACVQFIVRMQLVHVSVKIDHRLRVGTVYVSEGPEIAKKKPLIPFPQEVTISSGARSQRRGRAATMPTPSVHIIHSIFNRCERSQENSADKRTLFESRKGPMSMSSSCSLPPLPNYSSIDPR